MRAGTGSCSNRLHGGECLPTFHSIASLTEAISNTFDGKHPCRLCVQIQNGRQQQERERSTRPWLKPDKQPDLFCSRPSPILIAAPVQASACVPFVPALHCDRADTPPTPPPRAYPG